MKYGCTGQRVAFLRVGSLFCASQCLHATPAAGPGAAAALCASKQLHICCAGTTYAPEGSVLDSNGQEVASASEQPALRALAQCCALCNDSSLYYAPGGALHNVQSFLPQTPAPC